MSKSGIKEIGNLPAEVDAISADEEMLESPDPGTKELDEKDKEEA